MWSKERFSIISTTMRLKLSSPAGGMDGDHSIVGRSSSRAPGPTARGESPTAFERRCIPAGCVAPPSNVPDILGRHALPAGRLAVLGATPDFHHGLLDEAEQWLTAQLKK